MIFTDPTRNIVLTSEAVCRLHFFDRAKAKDYADDIAIIFMAGAMTNSSAEQMTPNEMTEPVIRSGWNRGKHHLYQTHKND